MSVVLLYYGVAATKFVRKRLFRSNRGVAAGAAFALNSFGEDSESTIALVDHSLTLNPSFWGASGWQWARRNDSIQRLGAILAA